MLHHSPDNDSPAKMTKPDLETRCKQAILQIADTVRDIDMKLSHIIEYGIPNRINKYYQGSKHGKYRHGAEDYADRVP